MSTLKDRLLELMKAHGLRTQQDLADFAEVSKGLVTQWFNGDTKLGAKPLIAFDKKTNYSSRWLVDGKGNKYKEKPKLESNATIVGGVDAWDDKTPLEDDDVEVPIYKEVRLSAGNGFSSDIEDYNSKKLRFSKRTLRNNGIIPSNVACVSIDGDSMEPVLPDGATVGIDMADKSIKDGKIYAINHGDLLRVKILQKLPDNRVRIRSYNTSYNDEDASAEDIVIIGRVFWWSVLN